MDASPIQDDAENERCIDRLEVLVNKEHPEPEDEALIVSLGRLIQDYETRFLLSALLALH